MSRRDHRGVTPLNNHIENAEFSALPQWNGARRAWASDPVQGPRKWSFYLRRPQPGPSDLFAASATGSVR